MSRRNLTPCPPLRNGEGEAAAPCHSPPPLPEEEGGRGGEVRRQRGYTLIEMVVVTAILALLATLIVPNLVAIQRSRALRETRAAILRLAVDARNKARDLKTPLILQVQGDALVLEPDTEQATTPTINTNRLMTGANTNANTTPDASSFQQRVTLGNDIYVLSARQNGDTMDVGNWRWEVYPDGSATEGGLVFQLGEERKALYLPIEEQPRWVDGDLPDPTEERWQAGEVEQRVSS